MGAVRLLVVCAVVLLSRPPNLLAQTFEAGAPVGASRRGSDGCPLSASTDGVIRRAIAVETARAAAPPAISSSQLALRQPQGRAGTWIHRHPVLFGALAGFGVGFWVGYTSGDDGVFDDYTASANGLFVGGIGAGVGAAVAGLLR